MIRYLAILLAATLLAATLLAATLLAACESNTSPVQTAPSTTKASTTAPSATSTTTASTITTTPATAATDTTRTLRIHDIDRTYLLHIPAKLPAGPRPLVLLLHGASDSAAYAFEAYHFVEKSDAEGFLLVAADAIGDRHAWQAYGLEPNDDVAFLTQLVDLIAHENNVDPTRIYLAGHSAGAVMAYRLAAEFSNRFAAVAVVAGLIPDDPTDATIYPFPRPAKPMPVLAFHGMKDTNLPFETSAPPAMQWWAQANGDRRKPIEETFEGGTLRTTYSHGRAPVILYAVPEGNHMWPGGKPMPGKTLIPVPAPNATDIMWDFFKLHTRA